MIIVEARMQDYAGRRARVAAWLKEEGIAACMLRDTEGARDSSIRYLCGQPGDALLIIAADGRSVLVAWDVNMAHAMAEVGEILAYTDFRRLPTEALRAVLLRLGVPKGHWVEIPGVTSHPSFTTFTEALPEWPLLCRDGGVAAFIAELRAIKDTDELAIYRRAAAITDELMDAIEESLRAGKLATEMDVALFIERECRSRGCEGTGFETLAAGPRRSFGIHAFPPYGAGPFATAGASILDFGVRLEGYTTDVTMSFLRPPLEPAAETMVGLVRRAHRECIELCAPGVATRDIALRADAIFAEAGFAMPHGLGHGVGLDAHEAPALRSREDNRDVLAPGHIVTIEPGLYDPSTGGIRLEDDVLITATGNEVITHSRIVLL